MSHSVMYSNVYEFIKLTRVYRIATTMYRGDTQTDKHVRLTTPAVAATTTMI